MSCSINRERQNVQRLAIRPKRAAIRQLLTEHLKSLPSPGESTSGRDKDATLRLMRNLNSIHLCIAEERPEGELFRGCARPQWWPSHASWGGTFIDMLNVETLDRIIEMLLSKKLAVLVREVGMSAADSIAYVGGKIAGCAQCRHAMCKCRLQKKQSSVENWLHGLKSKRAAAKQHPKPASGNLLSNSYHHRMLHVHHPSQRPAM